MKESGALTDEPGLEAGGSGVTAVVLAAGEGRRIGCCKALIELRGEPLLARILRLIAESVVDDALTVLGADAGSTTALAKKAGSKIVLNDGWRSGMSTSLKAGLGHLDPACRAFLVLPVDHALITASDLDAVVNALRTHPDPETAILRPHHGAAWGHPVLFARHYLPEFLALGDAEPANTVYRRHRGIVTGVPVENPHVAFDIDTPADLARANRLLAAQGT